MKFSLSVFFPAIFYLLVVSCAETEPDEIQISEPIVFFAFVNQDSISALQLIVNNSRDDLDSISLSKDSLTATVQIYQDSLLSLQVGIDTGNTSLQATYDVLEDEISDINLQLEAEAIVSSELDSIIQAANTIANLIATGSVQVDYVRNLNTDNLIEYSDSSEVYGVPLNLNGDISAYAISIQDETFQVSLGHESELFVDDRTNIRMLISQITLLEHSFDSAFISCETPSCDSNETGIICYF